MDSQSSVVSMISGMLRFSFGVGSVMVESDGTSHSVQGVDADLVGTDSAVVGTEIDPVSVVSSVRADFHPVDGALDGSSGSVPFGVPVFEVAMGSFMMLDGQIVFM